MEKKIFGILPSGETVYEYTLQNQDITLSVLNYGGIIRKFIFKNTDIVCGFDTLADYLADDSYQGAFIGRYANRIREGRFSLNGKTYQLNKNEKGKTHLHGGNRGFNRRVLSVTSVTESEIVFTYHSPDGEEGYPGDLDLTVTYSLCDTALKLHYVAISNADTPLNLTNHSYFNLNGYGSGDIRNHTVMINADYVTEVDEDLLPTGRNLPVDHSVFDLRTPKKIGDALDTGFGGYDTNFVLNAGTPVPIAGESLPLVAEIKADKMSMKVYTNQPDMQLYIGNMLTGTPAFKGGVPKKPHHTFCVETQIAPDSPNFGRGILRAGETYDRTTVFKLQ